MTWKINGVIVSETSKVNGVTWITGKKLNGIQLNVCYTYNLANNVPDPPPPAPPNPPIDFLYTDCDGNNQNVSLSFGQSTQVCALVGSVTDSGGGDITNTNTRCP